MTDKETKDTSEEAPPEDAPVETPLEEPAAEEVGETSETDVSDTPSDLPAPPVPDAEEDEEDTGDVDTWATVDPVLWEALRKSQKGFDTRDMVLQKLHSNGYIDDESYSQAVIANNARLNKEICGAFDITRDDYVVQHTHLANGVPAEAIVLEEDTDETVDEEGEGEVPEQPPAERFDKDDLLEE